MKKKFALGLFLIVIFTIFSYHVTEAADDTVKIGMSGTIDSNKNVVIKLQNINAKAIEGVLSYDTDMLQYTGFKGENNWLIEINSDTMQFDGVSNNSSNNEKTDIATISFKIIDDSDVFATTVSLGSISVIKDDDTSIELQDLDLDLEVGKNASEEIENDFQTEIEEGLLVDDNGAEVKETVVDYESNQFVNYGGDVEESEPEVTSEDLSKLESISSGDEVTDLVGIKEIEEESGSFTVELSEEEKNNLKNDQGETSNDVVDVTNQYNDEINNEEKPTQQRDTLANKKLPKTGEIKYILPIVIGAGLIIVAIVVLEKIKR